MSDDPWTLERVEASRPELAPLARLHRALGDAASRSAVPQPAFPGTPAIHWLTGRSLWDASDHAALAAPVAAAFGEVARATAASIPDAASAVGEILAAAERPGFDWPARLAAFRDVPNAADVPHPALFRFLLMRTIALPASQLARSFSAPHPDRWQRAACPWCGVPAAACVAGQGSGRTLCCVLCGGRWKREGLECVSCGEQRRETQLLLADRALGPASIEACATCRHALKVFAPGDVPDAPPVALEILTVHLDVLAQSDDLSRDVTALAAVFPPP